MKRLIAVAVAIVAVTMLTETNANAQGFLGGYQFGAGVNSVYSPRCNNQREDLPYFAKFPPVYYSNIVARPVGISPYAAPAGITPVEMTYGAPRNVTIKNPYFDQKATPVKSVPLKKQLNNKVTKVVNPYLGTVATR